MTKFQGKRMKNLNGFEKQTGRTANFYKGQIIVYGGGIDIVTQDNEKIKIISKEVKIYALEKK